VTGLEFLYALSGVCAIALLAYLVYALIWAEEF
jgi:K+-transporting ATPase KdpF subunit